MSGQEDSLPLMTRPLLKAGVSPRVWFADFHCKEKYASHILKRIVGPRSLERIMPSRWNKVWQGTLWNQAVWEWKTERPQNFFFERHLKLKTINHNVFGDHGTKEQPIIMSPPISFSAVPKCKLITDLWAMHFNLHVCDCAYICTYYIHIQT